MIASRILIGMPSGDTVMARTMGAMEPLLVEGRHMSAHLIGTYVERNQNLIVEAGLKHGADHIMFVDSDMIFPLDVVTRLLARKKKIVGASYRTRQAPHVLTTLMLDGTPATGKEVGLVEVKHIPSGMMLVKREVFEKLPYPWFFNTYGERNDEFVGNDINFCRKARAAGLSIWSDFYLSREITHYGACEIGWEGVR